MQSDDEKRLLELAAEADAAWAAYDLVAPRLTSAEGTGSTKEWFRLWNEEAKPAVERAQRAMTAINEITKRRQLKA